MSRERVKKAGKNIIDTRWVFKKKTELDGSTQFKSRNVSKGLMQVPRVNYTEKFAPVTSDIIIWILNAFILWYSADGGVCESVDMKAAFLEEMVNKTLFIEWPPGATVLGFAFPEDIKSLCIKCKKAI